MRYRILDSHLFIAIIETQKPYLGFLFKSVVSSNCCCCSVAQSCLTLCDPMDRSMPGFPVLHQVLEFAQTHVYWVSDATQPSHPLLPSSSPAHNLSQGVFQWIGPSQQVAKGLELQDKSFQWIFKGWFPLGLTGLNSFQSKGLWRVFSSTIIQKHQFFDASLLYGPAFTFVCDYWKNHSFD